MKTYIPKLDEVKAQKRWWLINLDGLTLGKAAIRVADVLRGKNKAIFTPHIDTGDYVVAINASKLSISGNKAEDKKYYRYSGYPGGLKEATFNNMMAKYPTRVFEHAVRGMLPKNRLGRRIYKKLHVYADGQHPHQAQKPEILKLSDSN